MSHAEQKYLPIYLNDHLTAATFALELVGRGARENRDSELGDFLAGLRGELESDRRALEEVMGSLRVAKDPIKRPVAWIAEKLARLKLNGELLHYSPLSRLEELEVLSLAIEGKRLLWLALAEAHGDGIGQERLAELAARAEEQRVGVEGQRLQATHQALS